MSAGRSRPSRWLSALKLLVLAITVALAIAGAVVAGAVTAAAWLSAQAGGGAERAHLERYLGWGRGAEVVAVGVLGSGVGLAWSRATGGRGGRR